MPPVVVDAMEVTVDFLDILGVEPFIGRDFGEVDRTSGGPATAIASYAFWRDRLDSDPDAVGSALDMDGKPTTIIGVLPEEFRFYAPVTLLVPLRDDLLAAEDRTHFHYNVLGRLRPDVTPSDATFEMSRILATVAGEDPRLKNWTVLVERMEQVSVEAVRPALWVLSVAVTLVLLIAIVNLAEERVVWALSGMWKAQHRPTVLDNGNMLLFDNQGHLVGTKSFSKVIEFNPFRQDVVWSYEGNAQNGFYTESQGRCQRLPKASLAR